MSTLGRISGGLLNSNLLRRGVDLAFDTDLLYLKISPQIEGNASTNTIADPQYAAISEPPFDDGDPNWPDGSIGNAVGINKDNPINDLDVAGEFITSDLNITNQIKIFNDIDSLNLVINSTGTEFTTDFGPIEFRPADPDPLITFDKLAVDFAVINDNYIESTDNNDLRFLANGTGIINLEDNTNITGTLTVNGNISIDGNLSTTKFLYLGDQKLDTVLIEPDFTQSIIPGGDGLYTLGEEQNDSSPRNWQDSWIVDISNVDTLSPNRVTVSDQQILNGVDNQILALQSNDDLVLNPATGVLYVEELKFTEINGVDLLFTLDNPNAYGTSGNDFFAWQVAIDGDRAIAGAYGEDEASGLSSGKAYIFDVTTGALLHTLDNPNAYGTSANDRFGQMVAISGNYAIVGAYDEDDSPTGLSSGKAYIFDVTTGTLLHTLDNPNAYGTSSYDRFGSSVAISGNYAIVGAYDEDDPFRFGSGKAYIFDVTTGALLHTLDNPNAYGTSSTDRFGSSVAISGNYAIVGADREDDAGGNDSGKAYIFDVTTGTLLHTLDNPNAYGVSDGDSFGYSADISGNYAIVGAYVEGDAGGSSSGKAYIFDVTTGALLHTLDNPNAYGTSANDRFGFSVAISGDRCIVAAPFEDDAGGSGSGKAYIFDVTTGTLLHTLDNPNASGGVTDDLFGYSVAISGDRYIVGAYQEDDAQTQSGKAYVYGSNAVSIASQITNLNTSTPVQFASTGAGYLKFTGTNAFVIPAGDTSTRPSAPELGDTRWNTELGYLECFDGSVYVVATGGGEEVTTDIMQDLGNVYTLILG